VPPILPLRSDRRTASPVGGALLGAGLVAAGLSLAFLTVDTPLASRLVTGGGSGSGRLPFAAIVWLLGIVAGGSLLVAGTDRLAVIVATIRASAAKGSPFAQALDALAVDVAVVHDVTPHDGRPVPTLIVGPFGVAVVAEMAPADRLRRVEGSWEVRTRDGWIPTEHPLDQVARDAERVRHWLTHGELDFVVRVYAALVTSDPTIPRSPLCAVITIEQIPAWTEGLPRQRILNDGRRNVLLARLRGAVAPGGRARDW
jgi:hypothetical protein